MFAKKRTDPQPPNCVSRFVCTKHSWRGKYRRLLCVSPSEIVTQDPDFCTTNKYQLLAAGDIDGVQLGAGNDEDGEIIISARGDKKASCPACRDPAPCSQPHAPSETRPCREGDTSHAHGRSAHTAHLDPPTFHPTHALHAHTHPTRPVHAEQVPAHQVLLQAPQQAPH
jgi:hypothetical protein